MDLDSDIDAGIRSLMGSNAAPSPLVSLGIEERVQMMNEELSDLGATIARKREELRLLELKHENRARKRDALRHLQSPFRRLPPEIVAEILIRAVTTYESVFHLGQICRQWRRTALSTPRLWTQMPFKTFRTQGILPATICWLERCGNYLPLSIRVGIDASLLDPPVATKFFELVAVNSHRCEEIHLCMPFFDMFHSLFSLCSRWDMLKSAELQSEWDPIDDRVSPFFSSGFVGAPLLTHVSLLSGKEVFFTEMPLGQLTSLSLVVTLSVASHLTVLSQCPNLITCTLHISHKDGMGSGKIIQLPHLKSLTISEKAESWGLDTFFTCLSAPSLQHFILDGRRAHCEVYFPVEEFRLFLARSECECQSLTLCAARISATELIQCLTAIPSLRRLSINSFGTHTKMFCDDVITAMTRDKLLQSLEELTIDTSPCYYSPGVLLRFVSSGVSRLKRLKLSGSRQLDQYRRYGLEVEYI